MTLRIDLGKTPSENLIDLILYSNADIDLQLNPDEYGLDVIAFSEEPGYNTILEITGTEDSFYTGSDWLYYNRVDLDSLYYRDYNSEDLEHVPEDERLEWLLAVICEESAIMKSEVHVKSYLPIDEENKIDGYVVLSVDDGNLLYHNELVIPLIYMDLDVDLTDVLLKLRLNGLNLPLAA